MSTRTIKRGKRGNDHYEWVCERCGHTVNFPKGNPAPKGWFSVERRSNEVRALHALICPECSSDFPEWFLPKATADAT